MTILIKIRSNFPIKLQKTANFSLKPLIFPNFRRLRRRKFGVLCPKKADFFVVRVPPWGQGPPLIHLWITSILASIASLVLGSWIIDALRFPQSALDTQSIQI